MYRFCARWWTSMEKKLHLLFVLITREHIIPRGRGQFTVCCFFFFLQLEFRKIAEWCVPFSVHLVMYWMRMDAQFVDAVSEIFFQSMLLHCRPKHAWRMRLNQWSIMRSWIISRVHNKTLLIICAVIKLLNTHIFFLRATEYYWICTGPV